MIFAAPFTAAAPAGDRNLTGEKLIAVRTAVVREPPAPSFAANAGGDGVEDFSTHCHEQSSRVRGVFGRWINRADGELDSDPRCSFLLQGKANFSKKGFELQAS